MIDKFLEYLAIEKRYSENTVTSYRKDLEDFRNFLLEKEALENPVKADRKMVRNFMVEESLKGFSKRSINRKLSALRSFYHFLLRIGEIGVSPLENIISLKFYPEKQIPFSVEEMERLQQIFEEQNTGLLQQLIVEVLYQTGMRKAELCNLLLANVDFGGLELRVTGKGNKTRVIPISDELCRKMESYLKQREPKDTAEKFFFVGIRGKKLNPKFVYSTVNFYLSLVTSKQKRSPHILRHTFATHVLNDGAEISKVKAVLGHESLVSTQVYTTAGIEQLKKVFNSAHPRAKDNQ